VSSVTALGKRPCSDCGGELEWIPAKQALACPFCGFVPKEQPKSAADVAGIIEHDLEKALGDTSNEKRGYGTETIKVKCQSCDAISVFEATHVAQRCDFCGSPSIAPYQETRDAITPESLLPVKFDASRTRDIVKQWVRSRWFAPDALKSGALTDTLKAIYLPYWTFDARAHGDWTAMSGEYYYTTESYTDSKGHTHTRSVRHTRWYPSAGQLDHFFDDAPVPGTVGVRMDLLTKVEPFPTSDLKPYDPAFVRGWTVERYRVDLRKAAEKNRADMDAEMMALCGQQVPGDTYSNLQVQTQYLARTFKHILVPVWLVTYTLGAKRYQVIVNGFTGETAGDRPISWVKVFFYIILPATILLIILLAIGALDQMNQ
jgi:hypothetical protein